MTLVVATHRPPTLPLNAAMLRLDPASEIARGNDRIVYAHPSEPGRCIKGPRHPEQGSHQNAREKRYFQMLIRRGVTDWRHVPEYFGPVVTDQGEGLVFALIQDAGGGTAPTLRQRHQRHDTGWFATQAFVDELQNLYRYLRDNWIVPSDINDRNIVCQTRADGSTRLWLIDGVSNPDFLPLANVWPWFARQKVDRRMKRFYPKLEKAGLLTAGQCQALLTRIGQPR